MSARSSCTLVRIVYCVEKSPAIATMLWVGSAKPGGRFERLPGKAGAPALVGLSVVVKDFGSPFLRIASSYKFSSGGSYMIPEDARRTVFASLSSVHEKPARGAKLFLSFLKLCARGLGP